MVDCSAECSGTPRAAQGPRRAESRGDEPQKCVNCSDHRSAPVSADAPPATESRSAPASEDTPPDGGRNGSTDHERRSSNTTESAAKQHATACCMCGDQVLAMDGAIACTGPTCNCLMCGDWCAPGGWAEGPLCRHCLRFQAPTEVGGTVANETDEEDGERRQHPAPRCLRQCLHGEWVGQRCQRACKRAIGHDGPCDCLQHFRRMMSHDASDRKSVV